MPDADPSSALFHTFSAGGDVSGRTLFINAAPHAGLRALRDNSILIQPFYADAHALMAQDWQVVSHIPDHGKFDQVVLLVTKQHDETRALMALGLMCLEEGGLLMVAGANDAGGKRIDKDFVALGLVPVSDSRNKSRVVQARYDSAINRDQARNWITQGGWQPVLGGRFISRPGLFSWDRIDQGSLLLSEALPSELSGRGADFGCGYGFLSAHVLSTCSGVTHLTALDADARAVEACVQNTRFAAGRIDCQWHDLTTPPLLKNLDFIVMNPPFHEGASIQNQLGISFIRNAAACLKSGGRLFMVANNHLPYEETLRTLFKNVCELDKNKGFKIIRAVK